MGKLVKLKNIYYEKVYYWDYNDNGVETRYHYFKIYDLNKEHIDTVGLWESVLQFNKYGTHNE